MIFFGLTIGSKNREIIVQNKGGIGGGGTGTGNV
jgi:hypothetical protein